MEKVKNELNEEHILSDMDSGIWRVEMDEGKPPRMYANKQMRYLLGVDEQMAPEQIYEAWFSKINPAYKQMVESGLQDVINGITSEVEYPWKHPVLGEVLVRCGATRDKEYKKGICVHGFHEILSNKQRILMKHDEAIANVERLSRILQDVSRDKLTGLLDREYFLYQVNELCQSMDPQSYYLLYLDVEKFKIVNDNYGVHEGDCFLKFLGKCVRETFPDTLVSRYDGDNYTVFTKMDFDQLVEKMEEIQNKVDAYPITLKIQLRFGIYQPLEGKISAEIMCDRAKLACESVKGKYGMLYAMYSKQIREKLLAEQFVVDNMEKAYRDHEFEVYYQPVCYVATSKIASLEALVRWNHPEKGLMPPYQFIPVFEENGFITNIDLYVLEQVCRDIEERKKQNLSYVPVSVNLSRRDFFAENFIERLDEVIAKYDVDKKDLHLEVTESAAIADEPHMLQSIDLLKSKGYEIWMDDFGSGYSSFNALKDINVDVIKIDMRFFEGFEKSNKAGMIIASILQMARWLKIRVVAEGVETEGQLSYLKQLGCEKAQGYYFSKPIPRQLILQMMDDSGVNTEEKQYVDIYHYLDFDSLLATDSATNMIFEEMGDALAIVEAYGEQVELIRFNSKFTEMMKAVDIHGHTISFQKLADILGNDDFFRVFEEATKSKRVEYAQIRVKNNIWINLKVRFIGTNGNHSAYYISLQEITKTMNADNASSLEGFIASLCGAYNRIDLIDYDSDRIVNLFLNDDDYYARLEGDHITDTVVNYAKKNIVEEDQEKFIQLYHKEHLENAISDDDNSVSSLLRFRMLNGEASWTLTFIVNVLGDKNSHKYLSCIRKINIDVLSRIRFEDYVENLKMSQQETQRMNQAVLKLIDYYCEVNLCDGSYKQLELCDGKRCLVQKTGSYSDALEKFIKRAVHPDDQEYMRSLLGYEALQNRLKTDRTSVNYDFHFRAGTVSIEHVAGRVSLYKTDAGWVACIAERGIKAEILPNGSFLAGIYNRRKFESIFENILREEGHKSWVLTVIDIDGFHQINQKYGTEKGDEILTKVAKVLNQVLTQSVVIGRIGADEFAFILDKEKVKGKILDLCKSIQQETHKIIIDHRPVTCSAGIAVYPDHADSIEDLEHKAIRAMIQAKENSTKEGIHIYNHMEKDVITCSTEQKKEILDMLDMDILICDLYTKQIYYINQYAHKRLGNIAYDRHTCYELLRGRNTPCEFCDERDIRYETADDWDIRENKEDMLKRLRDKVILWNNKICRVECLTDDAIEQFNKHQKGQDKEDE